MKGFHSNEETRSSLESIKSWLSNYKFPSDGTVIVDTPDSLKSVGFIDLRLEKLELQHQDGLIYCIDENQKPQSWTEFFNLVSWTTQFLNAFKGHKSCLKTIELMRGLNEYPLSLATFNFEEAVAAVVSAVSLDLGLNMQHPDTRGNNYAVQNIMVDDSNALHDIVRQVFSCLYSKCLVRLVVKKNDYYSAILSTFLIDLMHQSGATKTEISCLVFDRRDSLGSEKFTKCLASGKRSKLSTISVVFKQTDKFAAAQGIIESYFREQYQNHVVLVEEAAYESFVNDWQRYYSHALHIGSRLDSRTVVVDSINSKIEIDLAAIDVKSSHKMAGHAINVLKFRTIAELLSLLNNFRKVPHMTIWQDDTVLAREFCQRVNCCNEFWLNHIPKSLAGYRFNEDILSFYADTVAEDMAYIYNSVNAQFSDELDQLKKLQGVFLKKDVNLRTALIMKDFVSVLSKSKSLKIGSSIRESVARVKQFQLSMVDGRVIQSRSSRIEKQTKPVGLAIILVREESSVKSKAVLLEALIKNLLIGNAVLLACPPNTLGAKFALENDHVIPFKIVYELPDFSRLSLDESTKESEVPTPKKNCPRDTFAFEVLPDMTSESFDAITIALGGRSKHIWYPEVEQASYWVADKS